MCIFAFIGHWGHRGREGNFPHPPNRGRSVRGLWSTPRSESAGGDDRSPEGDPPRHRGQTRESGDAGGRATPGRKPVVVAAESRKHPRQPDEGRAEFTMVPEVESLTRGSDTSSPPSARAVRRRRRAAAAADRMSASRRRRFRDVFTSCCTPVIYVASFL